MADPLRDNPRSSGALPDTLELVPVAVPHAERLDRPTSRNLSPPALVEQLVLGCEFASKHLGELHVLGLEPERGVEPDRTVGWPRRC